MSFRMLYALDAQLLECGKRTLNINAISVLIGT